MSSTLSATRETVTTFGNLRVAQILTSLIVLLAAVAAAGGLFIPGLYRDPATIGPALQGQDLVTLLALPVLVVALLASARGSARAALAWIGLLGYVWYTYAGAALGYYLNSFILLYVALFSLSIFALLTTAAGIDVAAIGRRLDAAAPRVPIVAFLILMAVMLSALELGEIRAFLTTGAIPASMIRTGGVTYYPYVLDLGLIVPLSTLSAIWVWRGGPWGYVLASGLLIKSAAMGLALLSMDGFMVRSGLGSDGLEPMWAIIAAGGLGLFLWLFRRCRE